MRCPGERAVGFTKENGAKYGVGIMSLISEGKVLYLIWRSAVLLLSLALVYGTAVPVLHSNAWWIRLFDFPRIQIAVLLGLTLVGYAAMLRFGGLRPWEFALVAMLGLALVWQLVSIAPYTAYYPKEMSDSRGGDDSNRVSLLVFNVLHDNREVEALLNLIRDTDPDVVLLSEPTQWWFEQLAGLEDDYPHTIFQPQENHYGLLLYSKLELEEPEIRFLIEPAVPSIRTKVRLRSGIAVTLYGVHPRPPGLKEESGEREDSDMRDAELLSIAKEVGERGDDPVIVAGDFNDVAWSRTTRQFQRIGGFLDPRIGRGIFNTFDTRSFLWRYPLDHIFASRHFLFVELRRLPDIGSDHFPVLAVLEYNPEASVTNKVPEPEAGDHQVADKAIDEGKAID